MLAKLAARLGFVSNDRYAALRRTVDELRTEAKTWKKKTDVLAKQLEKSDAELKRHLQLLRHARADVERLRQRETEFHEVREQLTTTERALGIAREQLMAIEVKLDILEGAANVLDARTRTATQPQPGAGVPV